MSNKAQTSEVLLRMTDSGSTYMYWRWLDDPENPKYAVLDKGTLEKIEGLITLAMIDLRPGESGEAAEDEAVRRALLDGPFSNPEKERLWSAEVAALVLPAELASEVVVRSGFGEDIHIRVLPSPKLARVPWELLPLSDGRRLVEVATIRLDAPAVVNSNRGRNPSPWSLARSGRPLYLLEPVHHGDEHDHNSNVIGQEAVDLLQAEVGETAHRKISRMRLGVLLRGEDSRDDTAEIDGLVSFPQPSRLLYYGHADSTPNEPGSAAIHFTDNEETHGNASLVGGYHRPFTALDLLIGTEDIYQREDDVLYPHPANVPGHEIWPMPPRVALIACESGADHRALETFGLIMAILNAGAEIVTTTRWTLATDYALKEFGGVDGLPTTEVVLIVDRAHEEDDPVAAIRQWQLDKLQAWVSDGEIQNTPLIWAALTTHIAPEQAPLTESELLAAAAALE